MSEQDGTLSSSKQRRSRKTSTAHENGKQASAARRPTNGDKESWKEYWAKQGYPWRREPEIDSERQTYLAERRTVIPDINKGIYPFKDIKLIRADVEWLLATHESGRGTVSPDDALRWAHEGIDIRGADLRGVDLYNLPLAGVLGGLTWTARNAATEEERKMAAVHMEGAKLSRAHLEQARLHEAHLESADLDWAYMEEANLRGAHLDGAKLRFSYLKGAFFRDASLKGADLTGAFLELTRFVNVVLSDEEGTGPLLADAQWENINLALVKWPQKNMLGDEYKARQKTRDGQSKDKSTRLDEYEQAVRANRQLAIALQSQGLNEVAVRFAYRAQKLQRVVLRRQKKFGQYFFSLFLDLLAGYGYKPWRSFVAYLLVITTFAAAYFIIGRTVGPALSPLSSFVFSMTSFHGRGFFPGGIGLDDPLTVLAALEAFIGLLVEVTFIATLTQRLFGR